MRGFLNELFNATGVQDYIESQIKALPKGDVHAVCDFILGSHAFVLRQIDVVSRYALLGQLAWDMGLTLQKTTQPTALRARCDFAAGVLLFHSPYDGDYEDIEDKWARELAAYFAPRYARIAQKPLSHTDIEAVGTEVMQVMADMVARDFNAIKPDICPVIIFKEPKRYDARGRGFITTTGYYNEHAKTIHVNADDSLPDVTFHRVLRTVSHEYMHHLNAQFFSQITPLKGPAIALREELQIPHVMMNCFGEHTYNASMDERVAYGLNVKFISTLETGVTPSSELYLTYERMVHYRPQAHRFLEKKLRQGLHGLPLDLRVKSALHAVRPRAHRVG